MLRSPSRLSGSTILSYAHFRRPDGGIGADGLNHKTGTWYDGERMTEYLNSKGAADVDGFRRSDSYQIGCQPRLVPIHMVVPYHLPQQDRKSRTPRLRKIYSAALSLVSAVSVAQRLSTLHPTNYYSLV